MNRSQRPPPQHAGTSSPRRVLSFSFTATLLASAILLGACVKPRANPIANEQAAPAFALSDENGTTVTLASMLEQGPAVVLFYRGHW